MSNEDIEGKPATPEQRLQVMKAQAVGQATVEVLSENRTEIVRRARAKLVAMGIPLSPDEDIE